MTLPRKYSTSCKIDNCLIEIVLISSNLFESLYLSTCWTITHTQWEETTSQIKLPNQAKCYTEFKIKSGASIEFDCKAFDLFRWLCVIVVRLWIQYNEVDVLRCDTVQWG